MAAALIGKLAEITGLKSYWQGQIYQSEKRLDGQVVGITGANSGIGFITARELCKRGAKVVMMCRNMEKGKEAMMSIQMELTDLKGVGQLELLQLDLSSLKSVKKCAEDFLSKETRLDILVLNAGVMMTNLEPRTEEGFEMHFGTNHLGHFLLTKMLLPIMKSTAEKTNDGRIVVVASLAHMFTRRLRIHDLNWHKELEYSPIQGYAQSKLENILFAQELGKRLKGTGITTYSLHPGVIRTELNRHAKQSPHMTTKIFDALTYGLYREILKTPLHGSQTTLFCCLDDAIKQDTGKHYADCEEKVHFWERSHFSKDEEDAFRLFELSDKLLSPFN